MGGKIRYKYKGRTMSIDLNNEDDVKSKIGRIANECNIDITIKVFTDIAFAAVWDKSATVRIDEEGVSELVRTRYDIPLDKGWDIFLPKLRQLVEPSFLELLLIELTKLNEGK